MRIQGIHHVAYKCADSERTRHFYQDLLGLPLTLTVTNTREPTTGGDPVRYFHFFFELGDGSSIAFFDLSDDEQPLPSPNTPPWVNHLALRLDSLEELHAAHQRLLDAGVDVVGELDHEFLRSIYFFDPNGVRLELTASTDNTTYLPEARRNAQAQFAEWITLRARERAAASQPQYSET